MEINHNKNSSALFKKIYKMVSRVPKGKVTTYKSVACAIGKPRAYRIVGTAMAKNKDTKKVPCHRVIKSNGNIGFYQEGIKKKKEILKKEGIKISKENKINLNKYLFNEFI
ncbi:MAG: MGMT family protein [Armatimonadetes bacterium]|nr:MGMT family protein [Armatimonadota bacterium]